MILVSFVEDRLSLSRSKSLGIGRYKCMAGLGDSLRFPGTQRVRVKITDRSIDRSPVEDSSRSKHRRGVDEKDSRVEGMFYNDSHRDPHAHRKFSFSPFSRCKKRLRRCSKREEKFRGRVVRSLIIARIIAAAAASREEQ